MGLKRGRARGYGRADRHRHFDRQACVGLSAGALRAQYSIWSEQTAKIAACEGGRGENRI